MAAAQADEVPWYLRSSYPVLFPAHDALTKPRDEFDAFIRKDIAGRHDAVDSAKTPEPVEAMEEGTLSDSYTEITPSTTADIRGDVAAMDIDEPNEPGQPNTKASGHPFMDSLLSHGKPEGEGNMENKMLTKNSDVAYQSTTSPLVDLFSELEDAISRPRLRELLQAAWNADPLATLRIIFNARSIHLGKSSRRVFYSCAGWLAQNHPLTLVANLKWLSRSVIPKKKEEKGEGDDDFVLVQDENDPARYDVKNGVSHGYWKDLLNILAIAANGKLNVLSDPRDVLNIENPGIIGGENIAARERRERRAAINRGRGRGATAARGRGSGNGRGGTGGRGRGGPASRTTPSHFDVKSENPIDGHEGGSESEESDGTAQTGATEESGAMFGKQKQMARRRAAVEAFQKDAVYRGLHLTIARLFAEQLEDDLAALRGSDPKAKRNISLCAKWAPSHRRFHDRHTAIVSSIAEIMHRRDSLDDVLSPTDDRDIYLRHARERYRKDISALRKHLEVVERDITAQTFENIKYERVPSIAMRNYSKLFAEKDFHRFEEYVDRVAVGKAKVSGATLLPSTLVVDASKYESLRQLTEEEKRDMQPHDLMDYRKKAIQSQILDGQWRSLVQRIKDSGALSSSIAVCDVSGSMNNPKFRDGTCPMDSSVGLSLLVASATEPPFGGAFITFSVDPVVEKVDLTQPFVEQVRALKDSSWGYNTNFVAVFEELILPMALENKLKPEDMVKRVFVFSDMHFDAAEPTGQSHRDHGSNRWSTSYERIKAKFADAGYELPELVFWNLAGGSRGIAPKPVTTTDEGTSLVSGYSQGMLKVFLDGGGFEEGEDEEAEEETAGDASARPAKKAKMDPLSTVKKAIGHKAYDMLKVMD